LLTTLFPKRMQQQPYSQFRAMLAIAKASFRGILRSPSAVVFSIAFPLIFIFVFGIIGGKSSGPTVKAGFTPNSDTNNILYQTLIKEQGFKKINKPMAELLDDLSKGRLAGIVNIQPNSDSANNSQFTIDIQSAEASADQYPVLDMKIRKTIGMLDAFKYANRPTIAQVNRPSLLAKSREYTYIDFILPGMLGFSLLSSAIFGVAFVFFNLRQTLVLKRYFATPIKKPYIILGEAISRVAFQMIASVIVIAVGYFFFDFTLAHGWLTFLEILILSFFAFIVFMSFGFAVSGLAKNESTIPPFANLVTMPQFLMAGTFFSTDAFPKWLQPLAKALPLAQFNDAMRKISFEGAHLWDCGKQLGILAIWGIVVYFIASKVFRWE
jgi:ABC-2 type transport system permease protein